MKEQYFLKRDDYSYHCFPAQGMSGVKKLAVPKNSQGPRYVIKSGDRDCACTEFMALQLAGMLGVNVPDARLVVPKAGTYEVAIEYLKPEAMPDLDRIRHDPALQRAYVLSVLAHCLFEDRDSIDWLFSQGKLYTFDFAEGFRTSDIIIYAMEQEEHFNQTLAQGFLVQLTPDDIDYNPNLRYVYEVLVNKRNICTKEFFDDALAEIRSRFLAIQDEEMRALLHALETIYPAALITHFERYLAEIKKFCLESSFCT